MGGALGRKCLTLHEKQSFPLKTDSHLPKKIVSFASLKALKNDEKCFLFHRKSSFRSQDIKVFAMNFRSCREKDSVRKMGYFVNV